MNEITYMMDFKIMCFTASVRVNLIDYGLQHHWTARGYKIPKYTIELSWIFTSSEVSVVHFIA